MGRGQKVCRECLDETVWNDSPEWVAYVGTLESYIHDFARSRSIKDPQILEEAKQSARIALLKLFPEEYRREGETEEEFEEAIKYICRKAIRWAINRVIRSPVWGSWYDSYSGQERKYQRWPQLETDDGMVDIEFEDESVAIADAVHNRTEYLKIVTSPALSNMERELLVMWAASYELEEIAAILGPKYDGRVIAFQTVATRRDKAIRKVREYYRIEVPDDAPFQVWKPSLKTTNAECGTNTKYTAGCRCDLCRENQNRYQREWRKKNKNADKNKG